MLGSSLIVKRFSLFIFLSHCTEDCQITGWRHFTGDAKSQSRAFHGRCQITGSHISREMPNHRVAHFTGDAKSWMASFHGRCQIMDGVISREIGKLQDWSFNGRSTDRRIGRFTGDARLFPHCQALFIVHFFESLHGRLSNRRMAPFHGRSANYRTGHLTDDRQIAGLGVSRRMLGSSLIVKRFTGSRQITRSRISQEMPNHRVAHFTGDGQITGPRISREMPNRRSEHFTSCQSLHIFLHSSYFWPKPLQRCDVSHKWSLH